MLSSATVTSTKILFVASEGLVSFWPSRQVEDIDYAAVAVQIASGRATDSSVAAVLNAFLPDEENERSDEEIDILFEDNITAIAA